MKLLRFFIRHSLRDLWRNRSRTMFALICVATGVTAVVALRSLAFMVGDELTTDLAEMNHGDIRLFANRRAEEIVEVSAMGNPLFTREGEQALRAWADVEGVEISAARMEGVYPVKRIVQGKPETPKLVSTFFIEPEHYPFYSTIVLQDPAGVPLSKAFPDQGGEAGAVGAWVLPRLAAAGALIGTSPYALTGAGWNLYPAYLMAHPRHVVISSDLTRRSGLGLRIGDVVRLGAADTLYVVSGVVPSDAESVLSNPQTMLLDYIYVPYSDLPLMGQQAVPDEVFIKVPLGRDIGEVETSLIEYLDARFKPAKESFEETLGRTSVPELEEENAEVAEVIDKMILVMGLSSLLIGGIGIVNTMLVVVSRRTLEIAVLKTLGLKGSRITGLFLIEAALMGLLGSVLGVVAGVIVSYLIRGVGEEAFQIALVWRLYPEAMFSGLLLGMVMTVLFGFLPTLIAGQVRPAIVLRPNEAQMPAAGLLQTLLTLVVMIVALGLMVDTITEGMISISPVYMIAGGGVLVGLFAGVIIANTGLAEPIPDYYLFRLPRRFERLEDRITGAAGIIAAWWPGRREALTRRERGRRAVTGTLRGLRQLALLYGALAIGALLASGVILILSELWVRVSIGDVKPANDVVNALRDGDWRWAGFWLLLTLLIGGAIRWWARAFAGVIAMGSLGTSLGGGIGLLAGILLRTPLKDTGVWDFLAEMSTGVVLVEGALALLGTVYVGYWLLIWLIGKIPRWLLMGIVGLVLVFVAGGAAVAVSMVGTGALVGLVVLAGLAWMGMQLRIWERLASTERLPVNGQRRLNGMTEAARTTAHGASVVMMSVAAVGIGLLLVQKLEPDYRWGAALVGLIAFIGLWRYLARRYSVDARLVLREMGGRRNRVASTLLGLSVGIAGLSLVTLTTGAVSHLLSFQLEERVEGNLLILTQLTDQESAVQAVLNEADGVEHYSQFTMYRSVLMEINGEQVEPRPFEGFGAEDDEGGEARENIDLLETEVGIVMMLSERANLDDLPEYRMVSGQQLRPEDAGQHVIMLRESYYTREYDITTGDRLMYRFDNGAGEADDVLLILTVKGIVALNSEQTGFGDQFVVPPDTLPGTIKPFSVVAIAQVDESDDAYMDDVLIALSELPGVYPLELSDLTKLLESLLNQLKSIPTLVAWLALVAGTAIIANTVALATQERRRQIGVMKAVGLKGWRVLGLLVIENGLIGLIAGLIGAGIGLLITIIMVFTTETPDQLKEMLDFGTIGWLLLISIGVAVGAAMLSAWSAAAEKPMNVLRYE
ncbi:MAG: FtsX-like permease family protein [Anaerolineae bacterium]|nr:FtsX-like permease family protein [Anaerolineae bacterium]